jgi:hypothetical protein
VLQGEELKLIGRRVEKRFVRSELRKWNFEGKGKQARSMLEVCYYRRASD